MALLERKKIITEEEALGLVEQLNNTIQSTVYKDAQGAVAKLIEPPKEK